jgi:environmental stress-induced protein Ves
MGRLIRFKDLPSMPWKNGGGSTVELVAAPPGATVADFDFRISVATVSQDGPFSVFPNIDRTLALVEGEGLTLYMAGEPPIFIDDANPYTSFPGEASIHATVNDGTTMDFNVMTHRGRCRHTFEVSHGTAYKVVPRGDFTLLFVAEGAGVMIGKTAATADLLDRFDAVVLDPGQAYDVSGHYSTIFIVDIHIQACTSS